MGNFEDSWSLLFSVQYADLGGYIFKKLWGSFTKGCCVLFIATVFLSSMLNVFSVLMMYFNASTAFRSSVSGCLPKEGFLLWKIEKQVRSGTKTIFFTRRSVKRNKITFHLIYEYKAQLHILSKQWYFPVCCYRSGLQFCKIEFGEKFTHRNWNMFSTHLGWQRKVCPLWQEILKSLGCMFTYIQNYSVKSSTSVWCFTSK